MAIRAKLTTRAPEETAGPDAPSRGRGATGTGGRPGGASSRERTEEEKALRRERVAKAKDALARSADLKGAHVPQARKALRAFLQNLDQPRQPSDEAFNALLEAPFTEPPRPGRSRPGGSRRPDGGPGRSEGGGRSGGAGRG